MISHNPFRRVATATIATGIVAFGLLAGAAAPAMAATALDGPIRLGAAGTFGVLGASAVTNTGPTTVQGDVGVSPGTSITGFTGPPQGLVDGTIHSADAIAVQAQTDLTAAIVDAASLTPTTSGLGNLSGLSLTPGVYSGGELSLDSGGLLTLAGAAESVWVFQAASTLTVGSAARIVVTGGASACNVFWQVGSSATIGTGAAFVGTVLAGAAITATTGATIEGRLLADTAAVTLDSNVITTPTGCAPGSEPVVTDGPAFTSGPPPAGSVGTPYSYTFTADGAPSPTFTVSAGTLPAGLTLDAVTGVISGTPSTVGTSEFTVTASNGTPPDVSRRQSITVAAQTSGTPAEGTPTITDGGASTSGSAAAASAASAAAASAAAARAAASAGRLAASGPEDVTSAAVAAAGLLLLGVLFIRAGRRPDLRPLHRLR